MYTCIFFEKKKKKGDRLGAMREPLKNLISDIRAVTVTCNNCCLLACKGGSTSSLGGSNEPLGLAQKKKIIYIYI